MEYLTYTAYIAKEFNNLIWFFQTTKPVNDLHKLGLI